MFFLPVGHDLSLRRFPYLTVTLMVLCFLVQARRSAFPLDEERLAELDSERAEIEQQIIEEEGGGPAGVDVEALLNEGKDGRELASGVKQQQRAMEQWPEEQRKRLRSGALVPRNAKLFAQWQDADAAVRAHLRRDLLYRWGDSPKDGLTIRTLLSMFVHDGWFHLIFNLLFLWLVGCNLEDRWGRPVFLAVYLMGGVAAALSYHWMHPLSTAPRN